jgi:hypothetical protein
VQPQVSMLGRIARQEVRLRHAVTEGRRFRPGRCCFRRWSLSRIALFRCQSRLFANPYQPVWSGPGQLPIHHVTLPRILRGLLRLGGGYLFQHASSRIIDSKADLRWGFEGEAIVAWCTPMASAFWGPGRSPGRRSTPDIFAAAAARLLLHDIRRAARKHATGTVALGPRFARLPVPGVWSSRIRATADRAFGLLRDRLLRAHRWSRPAYTYDVWVSLGSATGGHAGMPGRLNLCPC